MCREEISSLSLCDSQFKSVQGSKPTFFSGDSLFKSVQGSLHRLEQTQTVNLLLHRQVPYPLGHRDLPELPVFWYVYKYQSHCPLSPSLEGGPGSEHETASRKMREGQRWVGSVWASPLLNSRHHAFTSLLPVVP